MEGLAEGNCRAKGRQRHGSDAGFSRRTKAGDLVAEQPQALPAGELPAAVCATHIRWGRSPSPTHMPIKGSAREIPAPSLLRAGYYGLRACTSLRLK